MWLFLFYAVSFGIVEKYCNCEVLKNEGYKCQFADFFCYKKAYAAFYDGCHYCICVKEEKICDINEGIHCTTSMRLNSMENLEERKRLERNLNDTYCSDLYRLAKECYDYPYRFKECGRLY